MVGRPLRVRVVPLSPRVSVAQLVEHSTFNAVVTRSSRVGDTTEEREEKSMTDEMKIIALDARYNRLYRNGRNIKSPGVLRKISRKKRKLGLQQDAD